MRKKIINPVDKQNVVTDHDWLDIETLAIAEVSSEHETYPIEAALTPGYDTGWRASYPGEQIIRLVFDKPQKLSRIRLNFEELDIERTQEYVLRCSQDDGHSFQEIVRQQWNFSPAGATSQIEEYQVELPAVTIVELIINPDISEKNAVASLAELRLA